VIDPWGHLKDTPLAGSARLILLGRRGAVAPAVPAAVLAETPSRR
jgi:hypothetical protein